MRNPAGLLTRAVMSKLIDVVELYLNGSPGAEPTAQLLQLRAAPPRAPAMAPAAGRAARESRVSDAHAAS